MINPNLKSGGRSLLIAAIVWFASLILLVYFGVLISLIRAWFKSPDLSYYLVVPFLAALLIFRKRTELKMTALCPSGWGFALVLFAGLQHLAARIAAELFSDRTSLILTVAGAILTLAGWAWLRILAIPIIVLGLMIPLPAIVNNPAVRLLQSYTGAIAEAVFETLDVAQRHEDSAFEFAEEQSIDTYRGYPPSCLLCLALVYAVLYETSAVGQAGIVILAIPTTILVNAVRIIVAGIMADQSFHPWTLPAWLVTFLTLLLLGCLHQAARRASGGNKG